MASGLDLTERGRRNGASDYPRQRDDGEYIWDHLDELRSNGVRSLQLDLQRLRRGEEQAGERGAHRIPSAEDNSGDGDEPATRRHLVGELMLVEREIHTPERGENSGDGYGNVPHALDAHSDTFRRVGMLTGRAHAQPERRVVNHERDRGRDE